MEHTMTVWAFNKADNPDVIEEVYQSLLAGKSRMFFRYAFSGYSLGAVQNWIEYFIIRIKAQSELKRKLKLWID